MQDTSISWSDFSWNPIRGCSMISAGCKSCYAMSLAARHSVASAKRPNPPFAGFAKFRIVGGKREAHWTGKVELIESKLLEPLSWRRKAAKFRQQHGRKPRAFISMSDLFHENLPDEAIDRVFAVAALTPEINWLFLTKRAERMANYFGTRMKNVKYWEAAARSIGFTFMFNDMDDKRMSTCPFPLPNVALGVSVESQKYADERIPHLLRTPAAMRFVSYEPALEAVDFRLPSPYQRIPGGYRGDFPEKMVKPNMIICGGESGPGARPFDIAWARSTVKQCRAAGTAPFVKQMGSKPERLMSINAALELQRFAGRNPDKPEPQYFRDRKGEDMSEWPEDLRVREWPEGWN